MIWALLVGGLVSLFILFRGTPLARPEVLRERVAAHVTDEARAEAATAKLDQLETLMTDYLDAREAEVEGLGQPLGASPASRERLVEILEACAEAEERFVTEAFGLREQLKADITAAEWPAVFAITSPAGDTAGE